MGKCEPVGDGVYEAKIDVGAGWRLYFARVGADIVLLLAGGSKRTQVEDIKVAKNRLNEFRKSKGQGK